jgi:hypothetical protein
METQCTIDQERLKHQAVLIKELEEKLAAK